MGALILLIVLYGCKEVTQQPDTDASIEHTSNAESVAKTIELDSTISKGIVLPANSNSWTNCCIYIPKNGLTIYSSPKGVAIGKLVPIQSSDNKEYYEARIKIANGISETFGLENFEMVGYEIFALKFLDNQSGYIQLENELWIKVSELYNNNLNPNSWLEYVVNKKDVLGWYANDPGISLRKEPNNNSKEIKRLKSDLVEITLTKNIKGHWVKVLVTEYDFHPCNDSQSKSINTFNGWIKVISEIGTLNIWHYVNGC